MSNLLLISTAMIISSFTANAAPNIFDGAYVGGGAGFVRSKTQTTVTEAVINFTNTTGIALNQKKISNGFLLNLYTGYGKVLRNSFYLGGEVLIIGDFTKRNVTLIDTVDPINSNVSYAANTKYDHKLVISFAPRFGYIFSNNLIYVKLGIETSRDKVTATYNGVNRRTGVTLSSSASASKTNIVFTPTLGYEKIRGHIIFRGEYTYNPGKKISISSNMKGISGYDNASYSDHRFMLGVAYKF